MCSNQRYRTAARLHSENVHRRSLDPSPTRTVHVHEPRLQHTLLEKRTLPSILLEPVPKPNCLVSRTVAQGATMHRQRNRTRQSSTARRHLLFVAQPRAAAYDSRPCPTPAIGVRSIIAPKFELNGAHPANNTPNFSEYAHSSNGTVQVRSCNRSKVAVSRVMGCYDVSRVASLITSPRNSPWC